LNKHIPTPCAKWAEKLAATHPSDLTPFERKSLNKHVESCSICATVLTNYLELDAQLQNSYVIEPLPGLPPQLLQLWKKQDSQRTANISLLIRSFYVLLAYCLMITGIGIYIIFRNSFQLSIWIPIIAVTMVLIIGGGLFVTKEVAHKEDQSYDKEEYRYRKQRSIPLRRSKLILLAFVLSVITSAPPLVTLIKGYTTPSGTTTASATAISSTTQASSSFYNTVQHQKLYGGPKSQDTDQRVIKVSPPLCQVVVSVQNTLLLGSRSQATDGAAADCNTTQVG